MKPAKRDGSVLDALRDRIDEINRRLSPEYVEELKKDLEEVSGIYDFLEKSKPCLTRIGLWTPPKQRKQRKVAKKRPEPVAVE